MFHTASTVCRPWKPLRSMLWLTTASGWALPPSTVATFLPPMKYSQFDVRCRAVFTQVNVTFVPTALAGQFRLSSDSTENWDSPPSHERRPLTPSTLCGSNWMGPQFATAPDAHSACRLGGAETYPWARAGDATASVDPTAPSATSG
jgi:hypothetical protein